MLRRVFGFWGKKMLEKIFRKAKLMEMRYIAKTASSGFFEIEFGTNPDDFLYAVAMAEKQLPIWKKRIKKMGVLERYKDIKAGLPEFEYKQG